MIERTARRLKTLGDPVRLELLNLLRIHGELSVQSLVDASGQRQANVRLTAARRCRFGAATASSIYGFPDDGPGIHPDDRPVIFDRFRQGRANGPQPGSGLGLAIARQIVERHGGAITVDSWRGEGATFQIRLPRYQIRLPRYGETEGTETGAEDASPDRDGRAPFRRPLNPLPRPPLVPRPLPAPDRSRPASGTPPEGHEVRPTDDLDHSHDPDRLHGDGIDMATVLTVDDEPSLVTPLRFLTGQHGHAVCVVTDGAEGVPAVRSHRPDLVLLDINLPSRDDHEVCEAIRAEPNADAVRIADLRRNMATDRTDETDGAETDGRSSEDAPGAAHRSPGCTVVGRTALFLDRTAPLASPRSKNSSTLETQRSGHYVSVQPSAKRFRFLV